MEVPTDWGSGQGDIAYPERVNVSQRKARQEGLTPSRGSARQKRKKAAPEQAAKTPGKVEVQDLPQPLLEKSPSKRRKLGPTASLATSNKVPAATNTGANLSSPSESELPAASTAVGSADVVQAQLNISPKGKKGKRVKVARADPQADEGIKTSAASDRKPSRPQKLAAEGHKLSETAPHKDITAAGLEQADIRPKKEKKKRKDADVQADQPLATKEWLLNRAGSVNMTCTDHKQSLQWVSAFHGMQDNRKKQRLTAEDAAAAGRSNRFARAQQLLHAQLAQQDSIEVTEDIESAGQQEQSAALHARNAAVPAAISPAAGRRRPVRTESQQGGELIPQRSALEAQQLPQKSKKKAGLLDRFEAKLQGSRFRWLNEQLYTQAGSQAQQMLSQDPAMYQEYHQGFQQQVRRWPEQPVQRAIAWVASLPRNARVVDFGCGDALLARSVPQAVASLDLVASCEGVIACNMAHTPLGAQSRDAAVFCLSLMGTDYPAFLQEAYRVLVSAGKLWIAEVRSRFAGDDFDPFIAALKACGFQHHTTDSSNKMFVVFEFTKKGQRQPEDAVWPELKPCLYKHR